MKKLFTLVALLAMFLGANAQGGKWVQVYTIDYTTSSNFPFFVMGYVPEFDNGCMTDLGSTYRYATQADLDGDGDAKWKDGESSVGTVMAGTTEYQKVTGAGPYWHQYFIADGIPTKIDGKYKVIAKVKASEAASITVNMGWNWSGGVVDASVAIPEGADFQDVEWQYEGIGGSSCNLVAQPGTFTGTIEWQSLVVYEWQKDGQRPKVWQEWLTSDGNPVTLPDKSTAIPFPPATVANWMGNASKDWPTDATADGSYWKGDNVGLICAWGKTKGRNLGPNFAGTGEGYNPFPADIEEVDGNRVFVVHGAKADTEGDAAAWDNQFWIQSPREWKSGEKVKIHFRYKASKTVEVETQTHKKNPSEYLIWHGIGNITFTEEWKEYDGTTTIADDMTGGWSFAFNLNAKDKEAIDFYFDDISWQSMVLDQGYFVSGINASTATTYDDLDNAIEFEEEDGLLVATVGKTGEANTYVDQIMISTVRGDDEAFKGATLKPEHKIKNDLEDWQAYTESVNAKLDLPGLGVWKIYIDTEYNAMVFEMLEGTPYDEPDPIAVVTNKTPITVNGQAREDLKDSWDDNKKELTVREEADENPDDEHGVGGEGHNGQTWDNQFFIVANRALVKGEVTHLHFKYKASVEEAKTTTQCHVAPGAYKHWAAIGDVTFTDEWQEFDQDFTVAADADGMKSIAFNMAEIKEACNYEITDFQWYLKDAGLDEGMTYENLINETGDSNFYKKEGADTTPYIPSGIINIMNDITTGSNIIYNLSGQRVSKDYKGIVIINGRKVVNK